MITKFLKKAFYSWIQLKEFDVQPLYLSADILQYMDRCNINLDKLTVYVNGNADIEQFANLAHSNQVKTITKLIIEDTLYTWPNKQHLAYFLQYLSKESCQLKEIDIRLIKRSDRPLVHHDMLTAIQILDYVPSLQRLSMPYFVMGEQTHLNYSLMTRLKHLELDVRYICTHPVKGCNKLQRIQDILYSSPSLQSFYISFNCAVQGTATLDFQRNARLPKVQYAANPRDIVRVIQNNQTKWYEYTLDRSPGKRALVEVSQNVFRVYSVTLHLPPAVHSFSIYSPYESQE